MSIKVIAIPYLIAVSKHRRVFDVPWKLGITVEQVIGEAKDYLDHHGITNLHISVNGYEALINQELLENDIVIVSAYHGQPAIAALLVKAGMSAATAAIAASVITTALVIGAGLLINSIMAPSQPGQHEEKSTYGWGGMQNLTTIGNPIPVPYGTCWAAPPIIGSYRTVAADFNMWQYLLFAVGAGKTNNPITPSRVLIGEELLTSFDKYVFGCTDGDTTVDSDTATELEAFPNIKHDYSYDRRLRYDPRANAQGVLLLNFNAPEWEALTLYVEGDVIIPTVLGSYCYECTTGGTSDALEPSPWGTTVGGTTSDGTVVWTCRDLAPPSAWQANTAYVLGEYAIPTESNGFWYECTTPGTSHATTEPTWPTSIGATVVDGGTLVWTCVAERNLKVINSSTNRGPWTKYGQAEIKLDTPKWGNGYLNLPADGDYLGSDDYETLLMSRPFQPEGWIRFPDLNDRILFFTESSDTTSNTVKVTRTMLGYINSSIKFQSSQTSYLASDPPADIDAIDWEIVSDIEEVVTLTLDTWYYFRMYLEPGVYQTRLGAESIEETFIEGGNFKFQLENDSNELITIETAEGFVIADNDSWLPTSLTDYDSLENKDWYTQYIGRGKYIDDTGTVVELYGNCDFDCLRITRGAAYLLENEDIPVAEITEVADAEFENALLIQTRSKCDKVRIILEFREGLGSVDDVGDVNSVSIDFAYWYRITGTSTWHESTVTCTASRVTSVPRFQFDLDLPNRRFYDILIFRKSPEIENSTTDKDLSWLISFQEILNLRQLYPGMQVMVIGVKASDRSSGQLGVVKVQHQRTSIEVPTWDNENTQMVDPSTPAWQMYDACTNALYGMKQDPSDLHQSSLEDWEDWTEDLVDGNKRSTCNIVYDEASNFADGFLAHIEQAGRVRTVREGAIWKVVIDKPKTPQYVFSAGNILPSSQGSKESSCQWSGYDETEKVDGVTVTWWDGNKYGIRKTTALAKASWFESLTRIPKIQNVEIRGCNNEDEALRHARFRINKNEYITMQGKHKAGAQTAAIEFGEVITLIPPSHRSLWGGNLRKDHVNPSNWAYDTYELGDLVAYRNHYFECIKAGESDTRTPNWNYGTGEETQDGNVIWLCRGKVTGSRIYLKGTVNFASADYAGKLYLFAVGPGGEYYSYSVLGPFDKDTSELNIGGYHTGNRGDTIGIGRVTEDRLTQQITKVSHDFANREVTFEWCEYSDNIFYHEDWEDGLVAI